MPSFARELETTLHNALGEASKRRHEYATLEHLLIALIDDNHASQVMTACGVNRDDLKATVKQYLDSELGALVADSATDPTPISGSTLPNRALSLRLTVNCWSALSFLSPLLSVFSSLP